MLKKNPGGPIRSSPGRYHRHIGGIALPEPVDPEEPLEAQVPAEGIPETQKDDHP